MVLVLLLLLVLVLADEVAFLAVDEAVAEAVALVVLADGMLRPRDSLVAGGDMGRVVARTW
jgi:hypothetical protein